MPHLLDTNCCIRHLRSPSKSPLSGRLAGQVYGAIVLCSVVKAELLFGALYGQQPQKELAKLEAFFGLFPSLPFDDQAAEEYAKIRSVLTAQGTLIGPNDLLIAALALAHDLTLVSHNTGEFRRVPGLRVEDWEAELG
ncbi:MAG: type II toxin-antitoxin system VapC family toxin [Planctomycetota bacterium]